LLVQRAWFAAPRWLRFLGAGFLNTVFGYLVFLLFLAINVAYPAALLGATVLGILFNFFTTGRGVFTVRLTTRRLLRFVSAYVATYLLNVLLLFIFVNRFSISPALGQLLCMPPMVLMTFHIMNQWVFRPETIDEPASQKTD